MGDVTISDDPTSATNINSSASTTNLYVIGNVTVSDAVTSITNFVVTGGITATAGITATEVTVGGTLSSSVTGAAALTVGTINGNVVLSGLAPQIGVNTAINGNLGVTTALSNLTLNDAVTLAVTGSLNAVGLTLGSGTAGALVVGGTADIGTLTGGSDANQITFNGTTTIGTFANTTASTILLGTGAVTIAEALGSPNLALIIKSEGGVKLSGTRTIAANVTATDAIFKGTTANGGVTIDADDASGVVLAANAGVGVGKIVLGSGASLVVGGESSGVGTIVLTAFTADSIWSAFDVSGGGTVTVNPYGTITQGSGYGIGAAADSSELNLGTKTKLTYANNLITLGIVGTADAANNIVKVNNGATGLNLAKSLTVGSGVTLDLKSSAGTNVEFYDESLTLTVAAGGVIKVPNTGSMWAPFRTNATQSDGSTSITNKAKVRIYGSVIQGAVAGKGGINVPDDNTTDKISDFTFSNTAQTDNYIEFATSNAFGVAGAFPVGGVVTLHGAIDVGVSTGSLGYWGLGVENAIPPTGTFVVPASSKLTIPAGSILAISGGSTLTVYGTLSLADATSKLLIDSQHSVGTVNLVDGGKIEALNADADILSVKEGATVSDYTKVKLLVKASSNGAPTGGATKAIATGTSDVVITTETTTGTINQTAKVGKLAFALTTENGHVIDGAGSAYGQGSEANPAAIGSISAGEGTAVTISADA
jgi:hypothetical protein